MHLRLVGLLAGLSLMVCSSGLANVVEVFAKGSASKSYITADKHTVSVSATGGLAVTLIPRVRIEGRCTNISSLQNRLEVVSTSVLGTLSDIKTETMIYSVGLDIDILGSKSAFQPFIFVGAGYIETERSYYFTLEGDTDSSYHQEPREVGVSGNLGLGFRLQLARAFAFEVELFGYGIDIDKPRPLINLYGTVGVRLYI